MNEKNDTAWLLFLNPPPVLSILRFLEKWSYDILRDLLTIFLLWNVNDNKFFCVSNFDSGSIICSEVVPINRFPLVNTLDPGFKVFEAGNHFHLETPSQKIVELLTASITFPLFYNREGKDSLKSFNPSFIRTSIPCPACSEHLLLQVVWLRKAT